uniref:NADH dehydrogenase subunit 4L n=1 Tax=Lingula reevii TaxID=2792136 RepID=UPI002E762204|nr:NADH dehydrogenase subunit 4L [Lingula reevii]WQG15353.1 NADH dehydrogenase subunit 4L [Lingula reevii]
MAILLSLWLVFLVLNIILLITRKKHLLSILLSLETLSYLGASLYGLVFKASSLWFLGLVAAFSAIEAATGLVLLVLLIRWSGNDRPCWLHLSDL